MWFSLRCHLSQCSIIAQVALRVLTFVRPARALREASVRVGLGVEGALWIPSSPKASGASDHVIRQRLSLKLTHSGRFFKPSSRIFSQKLLLGSYYGSYSNRIREFSRILEPSFQTFFLNLLGSSWIFFPKSKRRLAQRWPSEPYYRRMKVLDWNPR